MEKLKGGLVILNFHQVSDTFDHLYHTRGTYTHFDAFKKLIRKINSRHGIFSLKEGVSLLSDGKIKNDIIFAISFDDGDISLKETALAFLSKEKIPATLFLNTAYLDNQSTNWVRAYEYLRASRHPILNDEQLPANIFAEIRNTSDPGHYNKYRKILERAFSALEEKPEFTLGADDLKELDPVQFNFGLHGHEHQRFSMLSRQEQEDDISKNIETLEKFPNYLPYWAIPFGTDRDWNRHTMGLALEKELLVFHHTNGVNFGWNGFSLDRIPSDGRHLQALISGINV
jgi:peptidoglycan/xylan/chitin deacetylase (PgdA/CDA1 family)